VEGHISMVSGTPPLPKKWGGAPVLSKFGGSLLFLRASSDAKLQNLMWERLVFRVSAYPMSPALPNFWGSLEFPSNFAGFLSMTTL